MPLFENRVCPVCKRQFEEQDDVVFCPECGTPHHRECYHLIGHCVNQGLHKVNYSYFDEHKPASDDSVQPSTQETQPVGGFDAPSTGNSEENKDGAGRQPAFAAPAVLPEEYEKSRESIDGASVTDIAAAVRTNIPRFVGIFKKQSETGKRIGWNWSAFLFGSLYYLYRKMYRQGIALLCTVMVLVTGSSYAMMKVAPDTTALMQEAVALSAQNDADAFAEKLTQVQSAADMPRATALVYAFLGALLLLRLLAALLADRAYKNTVFSLIKQVDEQLENGAAFQTNLMTGPEEFDLSQDKLRQLYLSRKGGVSIFAPLAALLILDLIMSFFG